MRLKTSRSEAPLTGNLIIISAGKFGRETFWWASQIIAAGEADWRIKGFLDDRTDSLQAFSYPVGIIGSVEDYRIQEDDVFIGAVGDPAMKLKYYTRILEKGGRFTNVIHPLANVGGNVRLGSGVVLAPFASVTCDVQIGHFVSIGSFTNSAHDTIVGDWSQISSHCGINGNVVLGKGVFLGSHACILPQKRVGDWALVGAGAVVLKDVPELTKVAGNPARVIGRIQDPTPPINGGSIGREPNQTRYHVQ